MVCSKDVSGIKVSDANLKQGKSPLILMGLPGPHPAGVNVNKLIPRVISDSAKLERQGGIAQVGQWHPREPNIKRFAVHVEAALGNPTAAGGSQPLVGVGAAVTGNDVKRSLRAQLAPNLVEQVEESGINPAHVARIVVSQKDIQTIERGKQVFIAYGIHQANLLTGMGVVQRKCLAR